MELLDPEVGVQQRFWRPLVLIASKSSSGLQAMGLAANSVGAFRISFRFFGLIDVLVIGGGQELAEGYFQRELIFLGITCLLAVTARFPIGN